VQPLRTASNALDSEHRKFGQLLDELKQAHCKVTAQIANMDAITSPGAKSEGYAAARWRISQASMNRRRASLLARVALIADATEQDKVSLRAIEQADEDLAKRSHAHIAAWAPDRLGADWIGYCSASRRIRLHMLAQISLEQKILYPMLERAERGYRYR
jgi:hypothetical protein